LKDGRPIEQTRCVDFLLECIGFPPDSDRDELVATIRRHGEPVAYRGPGGEHLRMKLAQGIELRLDREEGRDVLDLYPYFAERNRLRVSVESLREVADSPFDALLIGWVAPPTPGAPSLWPPPGAYLLSTWLTDARRLPRGVEAGRVLAISTAGFSLDVTYLGPNDGVRDPAILESPRGASVSPLGGAEAPGGCAELSVRIQEVRHARNSITGEPVEIVEVDAPERPLHLFLSPWQLAQDGLPSPRPGYRVEGTFLFTGRIAGGLPGPRRRVRKSFG